MGFTQCHFFAGIGGWSYALRLAGWPDDEPVWIGSCPCQPFSQAGKRKGFKDKRHLWPHFARLIAKRRPAVVFGEQVASKAGRLWIARVRAEMEALGYAIGAADLCAAGISAPMVSQRLHWVAEADDGIESSAKSENGFGLAEANRYHGHWWSGTLQMGWNCFEKEIERGGRKFRAQWRVKPGVPLLAHGVPGRVAQLCGFGNAIVPQLAAEFIAAFIEAL